MPESKSQLGGTDVEQAGRTESSRRWKLSPFHFLLLLIIGVGVYKIVSVRNHDARYNRPVDIAALMDSVAQISIERIQDPTSPFSKSLDGAVMSDPATVRAISACMTRNLTRWNFPTGKDPDRYFATPLLFLRFQSSRGPITAYINPFTLSFEFNNGERAIFTSDRREFLSELASILNEGREVPRELNNEGAIVPGPTTAP